MDRKSVKTIKIKEGGLKMVFNKFIQYCHFVQMLAIKITIINS